LTCLARGRRLERNSQPHAGRRGEPFEGAGGGLHSAAFETRDHRLRRVHALGQLLLRETHQHDPRPQRDLACGAPRVDAGVLDVAQIYDDVVDPTRSHRLVMGGGTSTSVASAMIILPPPGFLRSSTTRQQPIANAP